MDDTIRNRLAEIEAKRSAMLPSNRRDLERRELQAQRESWVRAMAPCEHGVADFEECAACRNPMTDLSPERLEKLLEQVNAPWAYRPDDYDDWGVVRTAPDAEGRRGIVCQARVPYAGEQQLAEHRRHKTDPWEASASLIALAPDLARQRIADAKLIAELEANYNELLYGVSMKHEGESRHETALRYILRAEAKSGDQCTNSQEPTQ